MKPKCRRRLKGAQHFQKTQGFRKFAERRSRPHRPLAYIIQKNGLQARKRSNRRFAQRKRLSSPTARFGRYRLYRRRNQTNSRTYAGISGRTQQTHDRRFNETRRRCPCFRYAGNPYRPDYHARQHGRRSFGNRTEYGWLLWLRLSTVLFWRVSSSSRWLPKRPRATMSPYSKTISRWKAWFSSPNVKVRAIFRTKSIPLLTPGNSS